MGTMYFKTWVKKFDGDDTPTGDLASDILSDKGFPKANSKEKILAHLKSKNAVPNAIKTFEDAWQAYLLTR